MSEYSEALAKHLDEHGRIAVQPLEGHQLLGKSELLQEGDSPFDVYSGWLPPDFYNPEYHYSAAAEGRWIAWQRPEEHQEDGDE